MLDRVPKPSRSRSRRLRKKLKIEEFQELCFTFEFTAELNHEELDIFTDQLIDLVEDNGLSLFSSAHGSKNNSAKYAKFFAHISPSSCRGCSRYGCKPGQPIVESHRNLFRDFVEQKIPSVKFTEFSELKDLNYSDED